MRGMLLAMLVIAGLVSTSMPCFSREPVRTDDEIREMIIEESIASYRGSCPCPYSTARNGNRCGKRSAYSRPGGAAPLCYPQDVSPEMLAQYRKSHSAAAKR